MRLRGTVVAGIAAFAGCAALLCASTSSVAATTLPDVCKLVTPAEVKAVTGWSVSAKEARLPPTDDCIYSNVPGHAKLQVDVFSEPKADFDAVEQSSRHEEGHFALAPQVSPNAYTFGNPALVINWWTNGLAVQVLYDPYHYHQPLSASLNRKIMVVLKAVASAAAKRIP